MKSVRFFLIVFLLQPALASFAQEEPVKDEKQPSLEQAADDSKFNNGINFMSLKRYDKALEEFIEYLEIYYDGSHRSEVYARIAGIYFDRQNYLKAISFYKGLYEEFSNTEDGIGGYYNMGICYVKMGYNDTAMDVFNYILQEYPASSYAAKAQVQMDLLKIFIQ